MATECTSFFFYCYGDHRDLHSFPTRTLFRSQIVWSQRLLSEVAGGELPRCDLAQCRWLRAAARVLLGVRAAWVRSEEHTSELQSRENLVCRLLLEKKKK